MEQGKEVKTMSPENKMCIRDRSMTVLPGIPEFPPRVIQIISYLDLSNVRIVVVG